MNILVNNKPLDVSLEAETELGQIVTGIENWLAEGRMRITDLVIDDAPRPLTEPETWTHEPITSIDTIDITAKRPSDIYYEHLVTVRQYLQELLTLDASEEAADWERQAEDYRYVSEALAALAPDIFPADDAARRALAAALEYRTDPDSGGKTDDLAKAVTPILLSINARIAEVEEPRRQALATARLLADLSPELENLSVALQSGKAGEAMARIVQFSELTSKLIRVLGHLKDIEPDTPAGNEVYDLTTGLNEALLELVQALEADDYVLIGDLCEYEITPRVRDVTHAVVRLSQGGAGG